MQVNPDQLDLRLSFLRPIRAEACDKMTASMTRYGQLTPVTVVADKDRVILVDGFKRHRGAKRLGMKTLTAANRSGLTILKLRHLCIPAQQANRFFLDRPKPCW
jgi:ParB-like chromosome segregation protein Spo0J